MRHSSSADVKPNVGLTRKDGREGESNHRGRDDRSRVILAYLLRDTIGDEMEERLWIIGEASGDKNASALRLRRHLRPLRSSCSRWPLRSRLRLRNI